MSEVVDLQQAKLEREPHLSGPAKCQHCNREWLAVAPAGVCTGLQCPGCNSLRGYFTQHILPPKGVEMFVCGSCESSAFTVCRDGAQCIGCGVLHSWDDLNL